MARLLAAEDWLPLVAGMDAVVNAAGALQDGPRDRLDAIHRGAVVALVAACEQAGVSRFVQISAIGADPASPDAFFSTKGEGDKAVANSSLEWTILRPGLVIAPAAYGGTALLRALAAFPGFIPAVDGAPANPDRGGHRGCRSRIACGYRIPAAASFRRSRRSRCPLARRCAGCLSGMAWPATGPHCADAGLSRWDRGRCCRWPRPAWLAIAFAQRRPCRAGARRDRQCQVLERDFRSQTAAAGGNAGRYAGSCPGALVRPPLAAETGRVRRPLAVLAGLRHCRLYQARCGCRHSGLAWSVAHARTRNGAGWKRRRHRCRRRCSRAVLARALRCWG